MRLIDADKGLISKIQRETGCNFITAEKIVDSMSTVEERKVGKWIKNPNCIATVREPFYYQCSICECPARSNNHNYCPNCGAEMRGGKND